MIDAATADALQYPLLALALLANGFSVLLLVTTWQSIPASVPAHFGITGRPDRWGGRWILLVLVAVQAGMTLLLGLRLRGELLAAWCVALIAILMAYVLWSTIRIAQRKADRMQPMVLYGLIALLAAPPILYGLLTGK